MSFTYDFARPSLTVDVIVQTDEVVPRILLIRRKHEPFADLWALPGGFVDENEPLEAAARRELREETGLEVSTLRQVGTFGDPGRDPRGWTVTVVFQALISGAPPAVTARDDAADARWFPRDELPALAFDHGEILATNRDNF